VLVVSWASPVWADFKDGNKLYTACQEEDDNSVSYVQQSAECHGYITGVIDAINGPDRGVGDFTFCVPPEALGLQVMDIVTNWLSNHPQDRHYGAHALVAIALSEVWPCPPE